MNFALIFAGGVGKRMNNNSIPKQFLKVENKPIIVHTIEHFQNNKNVNKIVVVCVATHLKYMNFLRTKYKLSKIISIVPGGKTGQESIFNGLSAISKIAKPNDIVLIHDGVRPLINDELINKNIADCKKYGSSITIAPASETILFTKDNDVQQVFNRTECYIGRAPQCFKVKDIYNCHLKANKLHKDNFIDSAHMMKYFGHTLHVTDGPIYNIKITSKIDYYVLKAFMREKLYEKH